MREVTPGGVGHGGLAARGQEMHGGDRSTLG